jgi:flagellar basal body rod protein FlgG
MDAAISGLRAADTMFAAAAHSIANVNTPDHRPVQTAPAPPIELSGADLGSQMVQAMQASIVYSANLTVIEAEASTKGQLLSIRA